MKESEIVENFTTRTGQLVTMRLLQPDDAPLLVSIFENMSPASRYSRFNESVDNVSPDRIMHEANLITALNQEKKLGVIAFADLSGAPDTPIGGARLVEIGLAQAEVALSVRDDMQSLGVGTRMLRKLACIARDHGYKTMVGTIRNDNTAVWKVFSRLPFELNRTTDGPFSDITVDLTRPRSVLSETRSAELD